MSSKVWAAVGVGLFFVCGVGLNAIAQDGANDRSTRPEPRVVYPERTELDFEGTQIQGEIRSPGEFYFVRRPEEKFDSLLKRRKNFHQQMLRDAVLSR